MASPFAKISADLHQSAKIRRAGRNAMDVFIFALCRNAFLDGDGTLHVRELEPWRIADQCMMTEAEAEHGLSRAVTCDLLSIEGDRVSIVGWNDEWARRPLTDAERQSRRRENKKLDAVRHGESRSVRDESRSSHASVTSHVGEERRGEERRSHSGSPSEPGASEVPKKSRKQPVRPLPGNWVPNEKAKAKASELRVDLQREAEKFRNHADATSRLCANWDSAFLNWLIAAAERGGQQRLGGMTATAKPVEFVKLT